MNVFVIKQKCYKKGEIVGYDIADIYFSKSEAEKRAEELYHAFVEKYTVKGDPNES